MFQIDLKRDVYRPSVPDLALSRCVNPFIYVLRTRSLNLFRRPEVRGVLSLDEKDPGLPAKPLLNATASSSLTARERGE